MTLHDAIEKVLLENGNRPISSREIAERIAERQLYIRKDGQFVFASQVMARVANYSHVFRADEEGISLIDPWSYEYKEFATRLSNLLLRLFPSNNISAEKIVAAFLILVYEKGGLSKILFDITNSNEIKVRTYLIDSFKELAQSNSNYQTLFQFTINFLSNESSDYESEKIAQLLGGFIFNSPFPRNEFSALFNDVVNAYNWKDNFKGGEYSTPKLLTSLISALCVVPDKAIIFDPFAGKASLLVEIIHKHQSNIQKIIAGDRNTDALMLGSLNIYESGFNNYQYERLDAFTGWKNTINADIIVSAPPFGKMNNDQNFAEWQKFQSQDISTNSVQLSLYHLNDRGKAFLVLPESFLFSLSSGAKQLREFLVNENLIGSIIYLPKDIYKPYASINTILLVLDKGNINTEIYFYDARKTPLAKFKEEINKIISFYKTKKVDEEGKTNSIPATEILDIIGNLDGGQVTSYIQEVQEAELITLRDLLDDAFSGVSVSSKFLSDSGGVPFVRVRDLNDGEGLNILDKNSITLLVESDLIKDYNPRYIPESAVLVSKVGLKLKPTLVRDFKGVCNNNILVLVPNKEVFPEYIISQLQSDYVLKQVESIRSRNVGVPHFSQQDFLNIKIKIPPVEQQQYVVNFYSKRIADVEKSQSISKENELYNLISRIKHEVSQPVSSIGIDIAALMDYFSEKSNNKQTVSLSDFIAEPLEGQSKEDIEATRISNVLLRIQRSVKDAQESLKKAEETLNLGKTKMMLDIFEVKKFLLEKIKPPYINTNCIIEIQGKDVEIKADKYQLKILFKHLIENALKYGFGSRLPKEKNIIKIEIGKDISKGLAEIFVMNNGNTEGFNREIIGTPGVTTDRDNGSGFGLYHVKQIIKNHGGEFDIADEDEVQFSDFKVKFKIYLPLNL